MNRHVDAQIAVICGGPSAEAAVSRSSAKGVTAALRENYRNVQQFELSPSLAADLAAQGADVVFPVLHGPPGEDGTFQGFLEILGLPYVGSDVHASSNAMNKVIAKQLFRSTGLKVAEEVVVRASDDLEQSVARITRALGEYVIVKPSSQGSALGVQRVERAGQMRDAITAALQLDDLILVERRIDGREITVGVLDTPTRSAVFPVIEIVTPENSWYDYEHRYTAGLSQHIMPARLPDEVTAELQQTARGAHHALGCRDLSRADFVVSHAGEVYLLEVNTLPGMTPTSLYPEGAKAVGLDFPDLVSLLIESALARGVPAAG